MESIEQPIIESGDKVELIEDTDRYKTASNGESPGAENSPLHHHKPPTNSLLHSPHNQGLRIIILSSIVFSVAVTVALILTIYLEPTQVHGHAAVACDDGRCSRIGLQVMRDGGNAVDAAVAVAFCIGVVNPAHSGIGGGGFALVNDHKDQESFGYDFRETAPSTLQVEEIKAKEIGSVGIPGLVKGLHEIHNDHGKLSWERLVDPSIGLAHGGFTVSPSLARIMNNYANINDFINDPELTRLFLNNGEFKKANDTIVWPSLAKTLNVIRNDPESFYSGELMNEFLLQISSKGGRILESDMQSYSVKRPKVLKSKLEDVTVIGLPPPAGGTMVALMLNMIDHLNWKQNAGNESLTYHQLIETYKFAYAHRGLLGDTAFNPTMENVVQHLINTDFAKDLVGLIDNNRTYSEPAHYQGTAPMADFGTAHFSVIDSSELMVSMTLSLNYHFGSSIYLPSGIFLNDELMDFDLSNTSLPNGFAPGKRPQSSMSPTIMVNEDHPCNIRLLIGASGGSYIPAGITESVANVIAFKMNVSSAISAPKVLNVLTPNVTLYEAGITQGIRQELEAKGHTFKLLRVSDDGATVNAIQKINDNIQAYSDYRKFGKAAQY